MSTNPIVFVVDDDDAVRSSLKWLIESAGYPVATFASAAEFLAAPRPGQAACLVLDIRMEGRSGLELQQQLAEENVHLPIIFITGFGTVPMAVQAMQRGAVDFLPKPFNDQQLLACIERAVAKDAAWRQAQDRRSTGAARLAGLTAREREVLDLVVTGRTNKEIASHLHISTKTVEAHRAKIMLKTQAQNLVELVRLVDAEQGELVRS
jgi:FixJ family two-component response regulator